MDIAVFRYLHVQNGRECSKTFETYILQFYMDDTYVERKRSEVDTLFYMLNPYHPNVKFTLEQNSKRFLDTQIIKENNQIKTQVSKDLCFQFFGPR